MPHDILPVVSGNNLRKIWQKLLATFPTRTQVITLIEENAKLKKEVVQELPTENINTNCIYLVPDPNGTARNVYNEYMYIIDEQTQQGNWELIGTTRVDMTQYYTKTQTDRMLLDKQNRTDNDLPTESKTITGAISEIFTTLSNFISSTGTAITSLINRVTKLEPIEGTTADILQKFNDGEIPEGRYAESWDDDVAEFAIPITSEQYEALTEAQKTNFNYLLTDGIPGGMLLMDNYPREGSNNAVKSKGLYAKFDEIETDIANRPKFIGNTRVHNFATKVSETWIATEDCWICGYIRYLPALGGYNPELLIDTKLVSTAYCANNVAIAGVCVPVKKGQTVETHQNNTGVTPAEAVFSLSAYI